MSTILALTVATFADHEMEEKLALTIKGWSKIGHKEKDQELVQ